MNAFEPLFWMACAYVAIRIIKTGNQRLWVGFRVLGWAFIGVLTVFIILHGKDYYASPAYPMVFASGAIAIEQLSARKRLRWLKPFSVALVFLGTFPLLPLFVPVLSHEGFLRYQAKLPFQIQPDEKSMLEEPMPHYYSGCFGWGEMVRAVASAYDSVPPADRADTAIYADDYATAGGIDLLGPKYGLPKAISGHQSYWSWGRATIPAIPWSSWEGQQMMRESGSTMLRRSRTCTIRTLEQRTVWANKTVLLCSGKKFASLAEVWPRLKHWD